MDGPEAIGRRFPQIGRLEALPGGWDCQGYAGAGYVFKVPRRAEVEACLRREAALLAVVRPVAGVEVPDMRIEAGPPVFSWHRALAGGFIGTPEYDALDELQRQRLADDLAGFLADVHAIPVQVAEGAGAGPVEPWMPPGEVAAHLPDDPTALRLLDAAAALGPDPLGDVFGQFDGHGWNMAFADGRLNGIYDFGDAGIGPLHRDFIYASFISVDLVRRMVVTYRSETGLAVDGRRVALLTGWHRLWELALAAPTDRAMKLQQYRAWAAEGLVDALG